MSLDAFPQIAGDKGGVGVSYKNAAPTQLEQVEYAVRVHIRSLSERIEALEKLLMVSITETREGLSASIFDLKGEFLSEKRQVRLLGEHAFMTNKRLDSIEEALKSLIERRTWPIWKRFWYSLLGK